MIMWIEVAHRDQEQPQVAYLGQHAVQGSLIGERACDDGFLAVAGDLEILEPGGPPPVEDAFDPDLVARVQAGVPSLRSRSVDLNATEAGREPASPEGAGAGGIFLRRCRPDSAVRVSTPAPLRTERERRPVGVEQAVRPGVAGPRGPVAADPGARPLRPGQRQAVGVDRDQGVVVTQEHRPSPFG